MQSVIPPGEHVVIAGKRQGYLGLAIAYGLTECGSPQMLTAWQPTPEELEAINQGAPILVSILGVPPINPMMLYVGNIPTG